MSLVARLFWTILFTTFAIAAIQLSYAHPAAWLPAIVCLCIVVFDVAVYDGCSSLYLPKIRRLDLRQSQRRAANDISGPWPLSPFPDNWYASP